MRLSDKDIEKWLDQGLLTIQPIPKKKFIHGATIDLKLSNKFKIFKEHCMPCIDLSINKNSMHDYFEKVMSTEIIISNSEYFYLQPGSLCLSLTEESITLPNNLIGILDGRSSLARLGLMVHATSHRIDPGWKGKIVLEFFNLGKIPLALKPGMLIAEISFELLSSISIRPYNIRSSAKYLHQKNVLASRINQEN